MLSARNKEDVKTIFNRQAPQALLIDFVELDEEFLDFFCYNKKNIKVFIVAFLELDYVIEKEKNLNLFELEDFILKPFTEKEVILRLEKIYNNNFRMSYVIDKKYLKIDIKNYELYINGAKKKIAPKEIELLYKLVVNENLLLTREQLLDEVWGYQYLGTTRTVDVHIKRLRFKLKEISKKCFIDTVWGVGYVFKTVD